MRYVRARSAATMKPPSTSSSPLQRTCHDFSRIPTNAKARPAIHAKLTIDSPEDEAEREANRIADVVVLLPDSQLNRASQNIFSGYQNAPDNRRDLQPKLTAAKGAGPVHVPAMVQETLSSSGRPLDAATRANMEPRFGHDFSQVRVHTDAAAERSAKALQADAYTLGHHITFAAGQYRPHQEWGQQLLAHELTHTLQQGNSPLIQRRAAVGKNINPPADLAPETVSQQVAPADGVKTLRLAEFQYDSNGQPLTIPLSAADKTRLIGLLAKLKKDDPAFYGAIENEDVIVTRGTLSGDTFGLTIRGTRTRREDTPEARVIDVTFSNVLILDLEKIEKREKLYSDEYDKYRIAGFGEPPKKPQSAFVTLRHEAGHILFERTFHYDESGNERASTPLPASLKSKTEVGSGDEDIKTDMQLLSEYAAEGAEAQAPGEKFNLTNFIAENDPRFGVDGYHDSEGNAQTPTGFGIRVANGLTLIVAKQTARELKAAQVEPVFLLTVPNPEKEQRRFDVITLLFQDKTSATDALGKLENNALGKYKKPKVVAY
jgi:hypothetical protein